MSKEEFIGDKEALHRLIGGDIKAFDFFYHTYKQRVYGLVFRVTKSREEAEGLVHDTFIRLWDKRSKLDSEKAIDQWLFTVAYNLSIDRMRKLLQQQDYEDYVKHASSSFDLDTEKQVDYHLLQEQIDSFLETQPEQRKRIYQLSRKEGLSNKEIARQLEISTNTVENHLVILMKELRKALKNLRSVMLDLIL